MKLAEKLGFKVSKNSVYIDLDLSGSKPPSRWQEKRLTSRNHRPELERLMADIESGRIQAIIIRKRDRLCRNLEMSLKLFRFLQKHNVQLFATSERINLDGTASSKLELTIMMAIAEYQLDTTRENILQSKRRQLAEGLRMGKPVYGYNVGEKKGSIVINQAEANIVKEMYDKYEQGDSMQKIGRDYGWHVSKIRRCLENPCYIGLAYNAERELIKATYPPIMEAEKWYQIQQLRKVRTNPLHGRTIANHLSSGFLVCGYCNQNITFQPKYSDSKKTGKKLLGFNTVCPRKHPSGSPSVLQERYLDEWIDIAIGTNPIEIQKEEPAELTETKIKLEKIRENCISLDQSFSNGDMDFITYKRLTDKLKTNIATLESKIHIITSSADAIPVFKSWHSLTHDEKRIIMFQTVEKIIIYRDYIVLIKTTGKISIYPIVKRRVKGRSVQCLFPDNKKATVVNCKWQGQPAKRLEWK